MRSKGILAIFPMLKIWPKGRHPFQNHFNRLSLSPSHQIIKHGGSSEVVRVVQRHSPSRVPARKPFSTVALLKPNQQKKCTSPRSVRRRIPPGTCLTSRQTCGRNIQLGDTECRCPRLRELESSKNKLKLDVSCFQAGITSS